MAPRRSYLNSMRDIFEGLNEAQRAAVSHIDGPLLTLAGPGSGKTRVVTHRIAHLLDQGISPFSIIALTFTNKAAQEMKKRLEPLTDDASVWMGTFHGYCARFLRHYGRLVGLSENFSIYDADDSKSAIEQSILDAGVSLTHLKIGDIIRGISKLKNSAITWDMIEEPGRSALDHAIHKVYAVPPLIFRATPCRWTENGFDKDNGGWPEKVPPTTTSQHSPCRPEDPDHCGDPRRDPELGGAARSGFDQLGTICQVGQQPDRQPSHSDPQPTGEDSTGDARAGKTAVRRHSASHARRGFQHVAEARQLQNGNRSDYGQQKDEGATVPQHGQKPLNSGEYLANHLHEQPVGRRLGVASPIRLIRPGGASPGNNSRKPRENG